jgi:hypothetical protein
MRRCGGGMQLHHAVDYVAGSVSTTRKAAYQNAGQSSVSPPCVPDVTSFSSDAGSSQSRSASSSSLRSSTISPSQLVPVSKVIE